MWEVLTSITVILSIASVLLWVGTLQPSSVQAFTGNINQLKVDSFNLYIESSLIGIDNFIECTDNPQEDYQN
ncbi:MAG: hypothetical protein HC932_04865 [Thermales bacterium]|nr:hypothetical protein [Thermales bacterium]